MDHPGSGPVSSFTSRRPAAVSLPTFTLPPPTADLSSMANPFNFLLSLPNEVDAASTSQQSIPRNFILLHFTQYPSPRLLYISRPHHSYA